MQQKEFFKEIIDKCIEDNNMSTFYYITVGLISADNNLNNIDIKENCRLIKILIEVLSEYENVNELQEWKGKLEEYNKTYDI